MAKKLLLLCGLAGLTASTAILPAHAKERGVFRLGGIVPTICRLDFGGSGMAQSGQVMNLGSFTQLCNSGSGYRIIMQHPTEMGGSVLRIDGRAVSLSNGNETVIVDETRPVYKVSDVQLELADAAVSVPTLSFRIEPKGAIY